MKYTNDFELFDLVCENNEEATNCLFEKYKYIVDIVYNKYKRSAYALSIDLEELRQEAMVGFSDALVSYVPEKNTSLKTFISLCVERRVSNFVKKADTGKARALKEAFSLEMELSDGESSLMDYIGDSTNDPQVKMEEKENISILRDKINELLSPLEKEVFELLVNNFSYEDIASILKLETRQIYNVVHRIRNKIKDIL